MNFCDYYFMIEIIVNKWIDFISECFFRSCWRTHNHVWYFFYEYDNQSRDSCYYFLVRFKFDISRRILLWTIIRILIDLEIFEYHYIGSATRNHWIKYSTQMKIKVISCLWNFQSICENNWQIYFIIKIEWCSFDFFELDSWWLIFYAY